MSAAVNVEQEFQSLLKFFYMAPIGVVQMTADGDITLINPLASNLLMPLQADGSLVNLFNAIEHSVPGIRKLVCEHGDAIGPICKSMRFSPFFRARRYAEHKTYELTLLKIDARTLMGLITDVTDAVLREEQIRLGSAWYNALLNDQFNYGVVSLDEQGIVLSWNDAMEKLTGFVASDVVGKSCSTLFKDAKTFANRLPDLLYEVMESGWTLQNDWCTKAGGASYWASYLISVPEMNVVQADDTALSGSKKSSYVLLIRDIDKYAGTSETMMLATGCDDLTGVLNRRSFLDKADVEIKRWQRTPRPLCLLAIDADHFKLINDSFGHGTGDAVLKMLAATIKDTVRQIDITARIGGEEFVVLLPYTELDEARDVAERIRQNVAGLAMEPDEANITLTVSIGVVQMSTAVSDVKGLMKAADQALYRAKHAGRNQVQVG